MSKGLKRYLSVKEAAERTGLPRKLLADLIGSGLVADTLCVGAHGAGRKPQRVKLYVGEKALARGLLVFEDALRADEMTRFRNRCARGLGIDAKDPVDNVVELMPQLAKAAKAAARKAKRAAANGTTA